MLDQANEIEAMKIEANWIIHKNYISKHHIQKELELMDKIVKLLKEENKQLWKENNKNRRLEQRNIVWIWQNEKFI